MIIAIYHLLTKLAWCLDKNLTSNASTLRSCQRKKFNFITFFPHTFKNYCIVDSRDVLNRLLNFLTDFYVLLRNNLFCVFEYISVHLILKLALHYQNQQTTHNVVANK